MASPKLGDVALAMIEKRLLPTGKKGTYLIPGTEREVRGKQAAIDAAVEEAGKKEATKTTRHVLSQAQMAEQIHKLLDAGNSLQDVSDEVSLDVTHVGNMRRWATAPPIVWNDEDDLQKKVVAERDKEGTSWAGIAIRSGTTKSRVQSLYRKAGKDPHKSEIGKGGRRKDTYFSKSDDPKPEKKKAAKKPAAKKTTTKKATTKKATTKKAAAKKPKAGTKPAVKKPTAKTATKKTATRKTVAKKKAESEDTPF